jgi:hypothetical protein
MFTLALPSTQLAYTEVNDAFRNLHRSAGKVIK